MSRPAGKPAGNTQVIAVRMDRVLYEKIREMAELQDRSMNTVMVRMLKEKVYGRVEVDRVDGRQVFRGRRD